MFLKVMLGLILSLKFLPLSYGSDLTPDFKKTYSRKLNLSTSEQGKLKKFDFYLVPGILSETFIWEDDRSRIDFSILTRDYFSAQEKLLKKKYASRLNVLTALHFLLKKLEVTSEKCLS